MDVYQRFIRYWLFGLFVILLSGFVNADTLGNRTFTFVNNCSQPVWFGFAGGSAASNLSGVTCNSDTDCKSGAKCITTGATKQCFWINPQPSNGNFQLAANGGTDTVNIPIYNDGNGFVWSGAVAGRTACSGSGCQTADCGNGTGSCLAGQGFSQPATQAEFTLSKAGTDFYDVEIINGVNIPVQMSANNMSTNSNAPYTCGSPGAAVPSNGLGACSWNFNPPAVDYNYVTSGGKACTSSNNCSGGTVCGLSFNPGQQNLLQKTCGSLIGYWSADQVCGIQRDYGAPFNCNQNLPAPQANLTLWNLYACVGMESCYQNNASSQCCGCINWDTAGLPVPAGPKTQQCSNQNPTWLQYVKPTLAWLKQACPTAYTYPFDDMSSTFTCSNVKNNVNTVNYTITFCPKAATPPTVQFNYTVYTGYPFTPVLINNSITCPDPTTRNPACAVKNQVVGTEMVIKGSGSHICYLNVNNDGSLSVNQTTSNSCYVNVVPATTTSAGSVALPSQFFK